MDLDAIRDVFFQECDDQLMELDIGLIAMRDGNRDREILGSVFRAVHSIKGGGGAFGLDELVRFAHVFETVLDEIRSDRLDPSSESLSLLFRASDMLTDLVRAARDGIPVRTGELAEVTGRLNRIIAGKGRPAASADFDFNGPTGAPDVPERRRVVVQFRPRTDFYARGHEPGLLIRELARLGSANVVCFSEDLPPLDLLDPEQPYLTWQVSLETDADEEKIRDVFEFVEWDCDLELLSGAAETSPQPGQEALRVPARPVPEVASPLPSSPAPTPALPMLDSSRPDAHVPPPTNAAQQETGRAETEARRPVAARTIRVDLDRVDRLINLVGEMVISQAMLAQGVSELEGARAAHVEQNLDDLQQLAREIQDSVMAIRAQPVKPVFLRMGRIVREVADATGKSVVLVTEGEDTEVDKTIIDGLAEPLTHMIRNSIDHGLECAQDRLRLGKPAQGTVRLTARHRSGRIVIQVADDGAGIDRQRVFETAVRKNLIPDRANLSDEEIDGLIFLPGCSTSSQVSDISGRGVGMDVVRRSIEALGGRIGIASTPGKGCVFTLSLPLTLAVLDGMIVSTAGQTLVVPLSAILETIQPKAEKIHRFGTGGRLISVRNSFLPLIDVAATLGFRDGQVDPEEGVALIVETENRPPVALFVDNIQGQRQVVIKGLEANYGHVKGIAAATILGDGRIALILDVDALVTPASQVAERSAARPLQATG